MFNPSDLSVLTYANNFTLWHYKDTSETQNEVFTHNFFGKGSDMLSVGDLVLINTASNINVVLATIVSVEKDSVAISRLN